MRTALASIAVALSLVIAGCSSSTVEGDSATTTTSLARETTTSSSSTTTTTSAKAPSKQAQDRPAEEISELPETGMPRTPQEKELLTELADGGIDVAGVEDQLIATANTVCRAKEDNVDNFTLGAIAGQLIAQGRVDVPAERSNEVAQLIEETAERTYC